MHAHIRALFICKHRESYGHKTGLSSGLLNSARFVSDMLNTIGIESKLVDVQDNNDIDREVTLYKPTHVFIEALWVVPEKFDVLIKLHPHVKWIIRLHSEVPFIAMEGVSMHWLFEYIKRKNVIISANSKHAQEELEYQLKKFVPYLPNYYPVDFNIKKVHKHSSEYIDIGCFGAIRLFKNHLVQAIAAIRFAEQIGKKLRFHINHERVEGWNSDSIYKNLKYLFDNNPQHELVNHWWLPHHEFIELIKLVDIGMQVSFTETFNIVTADFVNNNVPVVVSHEITWASELFKADPHSVPDIINKLEHAWNASKHNGQDLNKRGLYNFSENSKKDWKKFFN